MRYSKHITISPEALQQARAVLEAEGFATETPPPDLLERGVLLTAYNPANGEGYLLDAAEVRLVAYHGLAALDPEHPDPRPRWERATTRDRERAYAEAALARAVLDVQSAPVGQRNNVLSAAAFGLGRLEHLGLDEQRVLDELVQAALVTGLSHQEAQSTTRRAWAKGTEHPRDLPPSDLGYSDTAGYSTGIQNITRPGQQKGHLGYQDTGVPRLGGSGAPKLGKGGK
ncbi:hypothetical protein Mterra_02111 [Calidithermus terrae]|uniref:Uncharacterized protein n=1 Tax=Calidithermus terrae TaxID=1408545 RepID=A0A399EH70_9DEIN|nr:hypothetical protein [Calidithermus terrae]RIH84004.1 hypothetical protein Mterra_02111 [Calidithermus terrae]